MSDTVTAEAPATTTAPVVAKLKRGRKKGDTSFVMVSIESLNAMGYASVEVSKRWLKDAEVSKLQAASDASKTVEAPAPTPNFQAE